MELELMKRSNLYKEMKEGVELEIEEEIVSNFFNFFRQICVDEEKDFDETVALIIDIVILLDVDKFLENFWTIRIIDFYCFDTNDTLVRIVNLVEREKGSNLKNLDFKYNELALFQKILYYASPQFRELNETLRFVHVKYIEKASVVGAITETCQVVFDGKLVYINFILGEHTQVIFDYKIYRDEHASTLEGALYTLYEDYISKKDEAFAEKLFRDIANIYNHDRYNIISSNLALIFKCPDCSRAYSGRVDPTFDNVNIRSLKNYGTCMMCR